MTDYTRYPTDLLPLPQLAGHGYKRSSGVTRVSMQSGRTRNRRKWFGAPAKSPVAWRFSSSEFEFFEGWVDNVLAAGAADFTLPFKTGSGLSDQVCRFTSDYDATALAPNLWEVKANIEIDGLPIIDENTVISAIEGVDDAANLINSSLDAAVTDYVTED